LFSLIYLNFYGVAYRNISSAVVVNPSPKEDFRDMRLSIQLINLIKTLQITGL